MEIMLGSIIVITIIYVFFAIWNTFVTKKQVKMSAIDLMYCMILGGYTSTLNIYAIIITGVLVIIWLIVMSYKWNQNLIEKNIKMMEEDEEAN